ncbi:MAG: response regulator [Denitrovibrio sp.]|nr:MAG: response regulator [Denitrovibrio sp.]
MISQETLSELTVLYVEDDEITREMACRMLSKFFKTVLPASNGREGMDIFHVNLPDIIITDLSMPEMSGFEMIELIRKENKDIPIVVTTAYRSEAESLAEVNEIVYKPVNRKLLLQAVMDLNL